MVALTEFRKSRRYYNGASVSRPTPYGSRYQQQEKMGSGNQKGYVYQFKFKVRRQC